MEDQTLISAEQLEFILDETEIDLDLETSTRYHHATEEEINQAIDDRIPANTLKKMNWVMKLFREWLQDWRIRMDDTLKVFKEVDEFNKSDLNHVLKYFYAEIRKKDGTRYPPETLKSITAMVQLYFRTKHHWEFSIFTDSEYQIARESLDAQMKQAANVGAVKVKKHAAPISFDEEDDLWRNGTFGSSNPRQLISTLIYHFGLHLSLRAGQEHRDLEFGENSQLRLGSENGQEFLEYTERISKNKRFGLKATRLEPKVTRIYGNLDKPERCVLTIYKKYVEHRPETVKCSAFYLTPNNEVKNNVWYKDCPMGIHTIEKPPSLC